MIFLTPGIEDEMAYEKERVIRISGNRESMMFTLLDQVSQDILGGLKAGDLGSFSHSNLMILCFRREIELFLQRVSHLPLVWELFSLRVPLTFWEHAFCRKIL